MLTAQEIVFVKDLIQDLSALADPSEYTQKEVDEALQLLNRIEPVDTERALELFDEIDQEDYTEH